MQNGKQKHYWFFSSPPSLSDEKGRVEGSRGQDRKPGPSGHKQPCSWRPQASPPAEKNLKSELVKTDAKFQWPFRGLGQNFAHHPPPHPQPKLSSSASPFLGIPGSRRPSLSSLFGATCRAILVFCFSCSFALSIS